MDLPYEEARINALVNCLELITPKDLALALGVTEQTLQTWRMKNEGPSYAKLGKQVFYRPDDVRTWVEANVVKLGRPATEPPSPTNHSGIASPERVSPMISYEQNR